MPKRKPERAKRGAVHITKRHGMIRLRWTHQEKPYTLSPGLPYTPLNLEVAAKKLVHEIERDIAIGIFDPTLAKYQPKPEEEDQQKETVELFQAFIQHRQQEGTSSQTIAARYHPMLANLKRFGRNIETEADAREFVDVLRSRQSPLVANQSLSLLKGFSAWAVESGHLEANPFTPIKLLKTGKSTSRDNPFTREEITAILSTIRTDRYYHCYHDFVLALFHLGIRPSEAIGLLWKHIDFNRKTVTICESLSRGEGGKSSAGARQRKCTKTGTDRVLDLQPQLLQMLQGRRPLNVKPDDLVFVSPTGKAIDDHSFSQRCWKSILQKAGVEHRPPYNTRHSLISHLIEEGGSLTQAAYVAGHKNTRMVADVYGHMVNRPKMPEF